jgi:hypothetical protein
MNALPGGTVGSDVITSSVSLTTSPQTTHTVTFTAVSGRKYVAMFSALVQLNSASGATFELDIEQDGTRRFPGRKDTNQASQSDTLTAMVQLPSTSGSTTVTVEASMSTGTGQLTATSTTRSTLIVLDLGE